MSDYSSDSETSDSEPESEEEFFSEFRSKKNKFPNFENKELVYNDITGYVCINNISKGYKNKQWSSYIKNKGTQKFIKRVSEINKLPESKLIGSNQKKRWN